MLYRAFLVNDVVVFLLAAAKTDLVLINDIFGFLINDISRRDLDICSMYKAPLISLIGTGKIVVIKRETGKFLIKTKIVISVATEKRPAWYDLMGVLRYWDLPTGYFAP